MNKKLLSVVITAYNQEKYIDKCIKTVVNQTYKNLDIVIIDDGSSDGTGLICDKWVEKDKRIKLIHKANGGAVSARKCGIKAAKGEYITCIDGDDWLELDHYCKVMSSIDDSDIYAFSLTCVYDNDEREVISNYVYSGVYTDDNLDRLKHISLYPGIQGQFGLLPSMCAKVFRTELIRDNMTVVDDRIRMGDDGACTYPSICDASKIVVNNEIKGYLYRRNIRGTLSTSYSFTEFDRIESLYHVLYNAFMKKKAMYMIEQMAYYFAFLFRIEMVNEMANPSINNILSKIKHIRKINKLEWVRFVYNNVDKNKLDKETVILLENIYSWPRIVVKWYLLRKLV